MLLNILVALFVLVVSSFLIPSLPLFVLRFVLSNVGWLVQRRTRTRREVITSQVRAEQEEFISECAKSPPQTQTVEEDWEKVDSSTSGSGTTGGNKTREDEDWDGVIGFFHPFW